MAKKFELKLRGRLGVGSELNELRILNRILRRTPEGLEYEADPRHIDLILESLELTDCKPVLAPGVKNPHAETEAEKCEDDGSGGVVADQSDSTTKQEVPKDIVELFCALTSDNVNFIGEKVQMQWATKQACVLLVRAARAKRRGSTSTQRRLRITMCVPTLRCMAGCQLLVLLVRMVCGKK